MICPSCQFRSEGEAKYCIRCGFSLAKHGPMLSRLQRSVTWIFRRSLAGLSAGWVGWILIPIAARAGADFFPPWAHLALSGAIGGYFLGIVEGMLENSAIKAVRGGLLGAVGGFFAGILGHLALPLSASGAGTVLIAWGLTGATIGAVNVWMEKRPKRILIGAAAGLLGGALGGWLAYQMYNSLIDMVKPDTWALRRSIEGSTGAVLGAILWCAIGSAEKFWIFRRKVVTNISYKECERCQVINVLKAWYCGGCGSLLQVAAPAEKMQWTKREALAGLISACRYLAQLLTLTGGAVALLLLGFLSPVNPFLGLFGLLVSCLAAYLASSALGAVSDWLSAFLGPVETAPAVSRSAPPVA